MPDSSPWDDIPTPKADFNVRQLAGNTAVPCFWARDVEGACLFIIQLQGDHAVQYRKNTVAANGLNIDLRSGISGQQQLTLTLERQVDRDLFESLCRTLASSLEHVSDSASSLIVTLAHVRRWKAFLAGRNHHLSIEEVRGLFAEITFLLELSDQIMSISNAIEAWLGAEKSHQDFAFNNTSVEIKSLSGKERSRIRISSEDQLESLNDSLFLRIYKLSTLPNSAAACSLNDIIKKVHSKLDNAQAIEDFDRKLAAFGYLPLPDYDQPLFMVHKVINYKITEGFPRIIRSQIPIGISTVSYEIDIEHIAHYECGNGDIFKDYS